MQYIHQPGLCSTGELFLLSEQSLFQLPHAQYAIFFKYIRIKKHVDNPQQSTTRGNAPLSRKTPCRLINNLPYCAVFIAIFQSSKIKRLDKNGYPIRA